MAKITMLTCDRCRATNPDEPRVDPTPAEESVIVGLDGYLYTLDLCPLHASEFHRFTQSIIASSSERTRMGQPKRNNPSPNRDPESAAIRDWARQNGWPDIGERGRIPEDVKEAYERREMDATEAEYGLK